MMSAAPVRLNPPAASAQSMYITSTMGPAIKVNVSALRDIAADSIKF